MPLKHLQEPASTSPLSLLEYSRTATIVTPTDVRASPMLCRKMAQRFKFCTSRTRALVECDAASEGRDIPHALEGDAARKGSAYLLRSCSAVARRALHAVAWIAELIRAILLNDSLYLPRGLHQPALHAVSERAEQDGRAGRSRWRCRPWVL